ncbi:hypothetical protein FCIRC_11996 [Fusarium circinatum]|uniref:Uncharacterized protein n=1 Tax=Fusarium circinatum TaxID=48490 RepID=A0A8H5T158_FUSCI|nr:hypothetical protein FCIRC_11996 [Fusarium circinatum]
MAIQNEQSLKRKSGEALVDGAASVPRRVPKRPKIIRRPRPATPSEDDEDMAALKLLLDAPDSPIGVPKQQPLNRASGTSGTTSFQKHKSLTCAGCGSGSHRLNLCMEASPSDGLMKGYPWGNTLEHSLANCPKPKIDPDMDLEMIQMRANMPSFQPTPTWVRAVRAAVAKGHKPLKDFPWTAKFTMKLQKATVPLQHDLDLVGINSRVGLPIDPDTRDWETVQRKFS